MRHIQLDNEDYRRIDDGLHHRLLLQVYEVDGNEWWQEMGRKWYYYDPSKPWKGGYWTPLLPRIPPYNEYEWNPETCRFEHKEAGEPLYSWQKPVTRHEVSRSHAKKKRPEWLRFLFEETPTTLLEKYRRKKWSHERGNITTREND